jgi:hypothetical protein
VNLNYHPFASEYALICINDGVTCVGYDEAADIVQVIELSGSDIMTKHCEIVNNDGIIRMTPKNGAHCRVESKRVNGTVVLKTGSLLSLGYKCFLFIHPDQGMLEHSHLQ